MLLQAFSFLALVPTLVLSVAPTDSLQDADLAQSGYLPNHNLHPATVGSAVFGQLWKNTYGALEDWYAKPLVFTPTMTGREIIFIVSNQNIVRTIDGANGTLINTRTLQPPFLQSDIGCGDIPNFIGVTGTPIIDPATEIVYFFSKGYKGGASSGGVLNGQYSFYGININTLEDIPGFPVIIDGHFANNDNTRYFLGGTVLQRPSLTSVNGVVIGGFGGHCDQYNYTGMLIAVSKTPGVGVTSIYAMEASPGAPSPQTLDYTVQNGGKAGIWQSGMGLATDGSRIFFATGNGEGHANGDVPSSGRVPLSTLDETVANFQVSQNGTFSLIDYFEPYEYVNMDAADRDLGSSGVALLDPTVFAGNAVSRIAVAVGKNGEAYILDANQLGGFKQGPLGTDAALQTITAANSVFGGAGSYPLEGGYIYFTPIGLGTQCYKLGFDSAGNPLFTFVGQSSASAGRVGVGIPTVTTYQGQPGTGILWITDVNLGLRAFQAVPVNQVLVPIPLPATPGLGVFQRPGFGNGRVYVTTRSMIYCLGSPVALPLSCSQPVNFGSLAIGSTTTTLINCTALIPISKVNGCVTRDTTFQCLKSTLPTGPLAKGANFSFSVTWNLTQASINAAKNATFTQVLPGVESTELDIFTTNGVAGYSTELPISIQGATISNAPFLAISPLEVDFGGIVVGEPDQSTGLSDALIVSNLGNQALTFTGFTWDDASNSNTFYNLTTTPNGTTMVGDGVTSSSFPNVGDTIPAGGSITIPLEFNVSTVGMYSSILTMYSTGGNQYVLLVGSGSTPPIANISISTIQGGWDFSEPLLMDLGNVLAGTTVEESIRLCNSGGSTMTITKSKPPTQEELTAANPTVDLHEGQIIPINTCAFGPVKIIAASEGPNRPPHTVSDAWTLNCDGLNSDGTPFGVHDVGVTANITTRQIGVLLPNGTARYQYLGCYYDGSGRNLVTQLSYNASQQATNENGQCQKNCFARGYVFAGTEYRTECWCGNTPPNPAKFTLDSQKLCSFSCPGDILQACGGSGTYLSVYYDITRYTPPNSSAGSSSPTSQVSISSISKTVLGSSASPLNFTQSETSSFITSSSVATSFSVATKTSPPLSPSSPGLGPFTFVGCYAEPPTGRALRLAISVKNMTSEYCASLCAGNTYFGTEYTKECYCGNSLAPGTLPTNLADCNLKCAGNQNEICGGSLRLSLYKNSTLSSSSALGVAASTGFTETRSSSTVSGVGKYPTDTSSARSVLSSFANSVVTRSSSGGILSLSASESASDAMLESVIVFAFHQYQHQYQYNLFSIYSCVFAVDFCKKHFYPCLSLLLLFVLAAQ